MSFRKKAGVEYRVAARNSKPGHNHAAGLVGALHTRKSIYAKAACNRITTTLND